MKVGLIGVGKWGRILYWKLVEAGAHVVAHDRAGDGSVPEDRFGPRVKWQDMLGSNDIDAVVAATPPSVTRQIFVACQQAKKPCLLAKPLLIDPGTEVTATTYVDYVHLYSPLWKILQAALFGQDVETMNGVSTGTSPLQPYPCSVDYGPHALSLMLTIAGAMYEIMPGTNLHDMPARPTKAILTTAADGRENLWAELELDRRIRATLTCGNLGTRATIFFAKLARARDVLYHEAGGKASLMIGGDVVARDDKHDPLKVLIMSFLFDVATRKVRDGHVRLSEKITSILTAARDGAEKNRLG